jgi:ribosome-associated heat shock protein Hsp15
MPELQAVRIDKWLWAARFAKTRAAASEAAGGGRVHVNGAAVRPSKLVKVGDRVQFASGPVWREVDVVALSEKRLSAPLAAALYEETPESIRRRAERAEQRRLVTPAPAPFEGGRPTKRDRRRYERELGRDRRGR